MAVSGGPMGRMCEPGNAEGHTMKAAVLVVALVSTVAPSLALPGPNNTTKVDRPLFIGMPVVTQLPFQVAVKDEAERVAKRLGAQLLVAESQGWPGWQDYFIGSLPAQGVRGIIVVPVDRSVAHGIEAAVDAGVPVATVGERVNSDKVLVHVGMDNAEAGRLAANFIVEKLGNRGSVIVIEGVPDSSIATDRKAGFEEVIGKSNVKILASLAGNSSRYRAQALVQEAIGSNPGFDAIFATNDAMIIGAIDALASVNIDPASKVTVGVDAIPAAMQLVKDGKLTATLDQSASQQARRAVEILIGYIENKTPPPQKVILIKPELLTRTALPGG